MAKSNSSESSESSELGLKPQMKVSPELMTEIDAIIHHHTKTHKRIDNLGRKLFNDRTERYRNTPRISSWNSLLKMLIDEYWASPIRIDEAELLDQFSPGDLGEELLEGKEIEEDLG